MISGPEPVGAESRRAGELFDFLQEQLLDCVWEPEQLVSAVRSELVKLLSSALKVARQLAGVLSKGLHVVTI